jgi:hypothetical protein
MTVGDLVTHALGKLNVVSAVETPAAEDMEKAIAAFNIVNASWGNQRLLTYALVRTTWTITASDGTYSVGTGSDVNMARPVFVDRIRFIDTSQDPDHEYDLGDLLTDAEYAAIPAKALTNTHPSRVHYNPTYPTGTITFYPVPTSATLQGVMYTRNVTTTAAQGDTVSVPPGYEQFYITNLAVELAVDFEREPSPALLRAAMRAEDRLKAVNVQPLIMRCDPALLSDGGTFNIETGE